jgi:putative DNA primase/helicase
MNGAHAPIDKTDWTPLAGKHVLIWPDRDKAGWDYALNASDAIMAAGAASCALLMPPANPSPEHPEGQPDGWDAADAVSEGFDVGDFLSSGERIACHAPGAAEDVDVPAEQAVWATEDALALTFTRRYADDWRYVAAWGKWVVWTGKRWQTEQTLAAQHLMRQVCREASLKADSHRTASRLASSGTVSGLERLARSDRRHAATADEWDSDFWLLNTPGGVVDLKSGRTRPHDRIDRMTKITTATPQGNCPTWLNFVHEVTGGDCELQGYLARVAGYALTGITSEHALFFLYGTGANGKSVFVNTLATILGDYATNAAMDTFMESRADRHPTDMAALRGARFVSSIETEQGKRWAESKLKALTGGDKISARFMRQDFFEFLPQFKLLVAGNHKPSIRNIDEAMKRRLHLIPFTVTIPPERRDKLLQQKLLAEADGILAWAVRGCLEWQRNGLKPPPRVLEATDEYFEGEDALGRWMEERCFVEKTARALTSDLFADWKDWAEQSGEFVGSIRRFSDLLVTRHFPRWRAHGGGRGFEGIGLRPRAFKSYTDFND